MNGAQPHGYESTFGEVSSYIARLSGSPIYSESYVRDNLGRITQRTEVLQGVTTVWGYGYDTAGRLVSVTRNGAAFESYTFDSNDNRLTKTTAAGTTTYAHDDQDRLLSAVGPEGAESWIYDGNGDLLSHNGSAGQTSYDYETGGQLVSLTKPDGDVVSYDLDASNKRAVKRVNGVVQRQWVYAGGLLPVAELDGGGNLVSVFNGGFMVKNGTTFRLLRDHLGSVRMVVDAGTGTVVQRLSYGPWGEVLEDTNPGFQPFGYAGGLYDPDTGLVRFGARDYDPGIGRWTCKDPIGLDAVVKQLSTTNHRTGVRSVRDGPEGGWSCGLASDRHRVPDTKLSLLRAGVRARSGSQAATAKPSARRAIRSARRPRSVLKVAAMRRLRDW